jgi:hypothetical protein
MPPPRQACSSKPGIVGKDAIFAPPAGAHSQHEQQRAFLENDRRFAARIFNNLLKKKLPFNESAA